MRTSRAWAAKALALAVAFAIASGPTLRAQTQGPVDPGVRGGVPSAGGPLPRLTSDEAAFFQDGSVRFGEVEVVAGGANNGLGPRFNSNQCFSCHSQPAMGGTSPAHNPLLAVATLSGAKNTVPGSSPPAAPSVKPASKRAPTAPTMAKSTTSSSSPDAPTPPPATSLSPTSCPPAIPSPASTAIPTSSSASPRPSSAQDSSRPSRLRHPRQFPGRHRRQGRRGHLRPSQRLSRRQRQLQRQRWHHHPLRLEGSEQIPPRLRRRSLQRRDGHLQPVVPHRAATRPPAVSFSPRPMTRSTSPPLRLVP